MHAIAVANTCSPKAVHLIVQVANNILNAIIVGLGAIISLFGKEVIVIEAKSDLVS